MENHFKGFTMEYIEQNKNIEANKLVKDEAHNTPLPTDVFFQMIEDASVEMVESETRLINCIEGEDW
jgi:hypothetical protein